MTDTTAITRDDAALQRGRQVVAALAPDPAPDMDASGRWIELMAPRHRATTLMLCTGVALFAFNGFLVTTVLPSAIQDIGGGSLIAWSISLYLIASIVSGASAARLKARFGARDVLVVATLLFLGGTLLAAFASSMHQVLAGRIAQGLGEGIVAALCYALIPDLFPSRLVPKVFGAEAAVWAFASFGGPLGAGWITEELSWRFAFLVNVPFAVLFLVLALKTATSRDKADPDAGQGVPLAPLLLLGAGLLMLLVAGLLHSLSHSVLAAAFGILLMGWSVFRDRKSRHSLTPKGAFALTSTIGNGLWVVLLMPVAQATSSVYLVFGLQHLFGYGPTTAGGLGAVMAMSWSLVAVLIANLRSPRARLRAIGAGPVLQLFGMGLVASGITVQDLLLVVIGQILVGAAFGASWGHLSQMLMNAASGIERDKVSTLLPTLQSAGYAIGAALAGLVGNALGFAESLDPEALRSILAITFAVAILWTIPAMIFARRAIRQTPCNLLNQD